METETMTIDEILEQRVSEELTAVDTEQAYDDMLDDVYGEVEVCGMTFDSRRILEELDPTAYRCGYSDFLDSQQDVWAEIAGEYYDADEVEELRETIEAELEADKDED